MSDYTFSNKDFLNPIITALKELGGSAHISEIEEQIIKELNLTEKQINKIHNGNRTKLNYDLAWARTYLKKNGLITNSSTGVWTSGRCGWGRPARSCRSVRRRFRLTGNHGCRE